MNQNEEKRLTEELELLEKVSHNNRTFNESMIKKIQEETPFTCEQEDKENLLGQYYPIKISLDTYKEIENLFGIGENVLPNYINEEDKYEDYLLRRVEEIKKNNKYIEETQKTYKKSIFDFETRRYK